MEDTDEKNLTTFGSLLIDCRPLETFLVDLPPGGRSGFLTEQEGCDLASTEVLANHSTIGAKAGVTDMDIQTLTDTMQKIALIDVHLPAALKVVKVLEESRAKLDDQRQRQLFAIASAVESRAKVHGSDEILAKYENVRKYRSRIGLEGWRTRRRNEAKNETPSEE